MKEYLSVVGDVALHDKINIKIILTIYTTGRRINAISNYTEKSLEIKASNL
jgi:hypothetical protein